MYAGISIDKVKSLSQVSVAERKKSIQSIIQNKKINDSLTTIFSSATTMIGCGIVVFPLLFSQYGLLTSIIMVTLIGLISFKTASLLLIHTKSRENDLTEVVIRVLGIRYYQLFLLSAGTTLFLVSVTYFLFLNNMLYSIINFISSNVFDHRLLNKEQQSFMQFSFQYCCIICCVLNFILINLDDLKIVMKLSKFSFLGIFLFIVFISYQGVSNIVNLNNEMTPLNIEYFTSDISKLVGNCATSFMLHNLVVAIYKQNKIQENNHRDLLISFLITIISYIFIGGMGYLAILQKTSFASRPNTVMDYYSDTSGLGLVVNVFIFYNLFTINPLISYYGKIQLLSLYYNDQPIPDRVKMVYNIIYILICGLLGILNISPISVLALVGALCGFYMIFYLPIIIHLNCIYKNDCNKFSIKNDLLSNMVQQSVQEEEQNAAPCQKYQKNRMKLIRFTSYGLLMVLGFTFLIITLVGMF